MRQVIKSAGDDEERMMIIITGLPGNGYMAMVYTSLYYTHTCIDGSDDDG